MKPNPYAPPNADLGAKDVPRSTVLASKWRRFGTLVVDYAAFILCSLLFGLLIGIIFGDRGAQFLNAVPDFVLGAVILFIYYVFFEGLWARTPGKLAFGTVVVTESGGKPPLMQIVKRTLCRFIPFEPFSFLVAEGWHDSLSRTQVIRTKR